MQKIKVLNSEWKSCTKCDISKRCKNKIIYNGDVPSHIVFIGRSPSWVDDSIGVAFADEAGKLFRRICNETCPPWISFSFTYLTACAPLLPEGADREPSKKEILNCLPRVVSFLKIAKPLLIVQLGDTVTKAISYVSEDLQLMREKKLYTPMYLKLYEPSYIYRSGAEESVQYDQTIARLRNAVKEIEDR